MFLFFEESAPFPTRFFLDKDVVLLRHLLQFAGFDLRRDLFRRRRRGYARWVICVALICLLRASIAQAEIELPRINPELPIQIQSEVGSHWNEGAYEVWHLQGNCRITQGTMETRSTEALLWIRRPQPGEELPHKIITYLEGRVHILQNRADFVLPVAAESENDGSQSWLGEFISTSSPRMQVQKEVLPQISVPEIYKRGIELRRPRSFESMRPLQYTISAEELPPTQDSEGGRRLSAHPRGNGKVQAQWFPSTDGKEMVAVITSGVNLLIEGVALPGESQSGIIDVLTDRMVIWTSGDLPLDMSGESVQDKNIPMEIYMEGNIIFRHGDRVIYADRMYYDVRNQVGQILDAEIFTPVEGYNGLLRLKSEVIRQLGEDRFLAQDSYLTSSRMALPTYRMASNEIFIEDRRHPAFEPFTGLPRIDPATGEQFTEHERLATSTNNFLYLGPLPVMYWPRMATNLEDSTFYLRGAQLKTDQIFGTAIYTEWDGYQLLGLRNRPVGTDLGLSLDYLSARGFAGGGRYSYNRDGLFTLPGRNQGAIDFWGISDSGRDILGGDRNYLAFPDNSRYRFFVQHRHQLPNNFQLSAEVGSLSDRNFLEQYFEREWDQKKDLSTGLELKQIHDNMSWSVTADARLNPFFTQTQWLPRVDHFWLGQPLLNDWLTWYEHSSAGYAELKTAEAPSDPLELAKFALLPWEANSNGERFTTKHEIDLPVQAGPVKFVPYLLGELAHWGDDLTGDNLDRMYGQVGLKASVPFWAVNPYIQDELLNVHGIAHKMVLDGEISYADANKDMTQLPLFDPLDDDNIEHFRRRFAFNTYGGSTPLQVDERMYALRTGLAGWVTSPAVEVADDLTTLRMGLRQRWQTKRGPVDNRRIIDWITLDTEAVWFPKSGQDNFGENFGLANYDFRWHVGDRLTLLSGGSFDFFNFGQNIIHVGGFLTRPPRGSLYVGFRSLDGPLNSQVVSTSYSYRLSPKWISTAGASMDIAGNGNIGQMFSVTRVGESFLLSVGFNVDSAKDNVGVSFLLEPRFLPKTRLGNVAGAQIPVAGLYGLE